MTGDRLMLVVDDDITFARVMKRSFERRGYQVLVATGFDDVKTVLADRTPTHAVVDLKLVGPSGLACVEALHAHNPGMAIVVLTGYVSIATAVEAIKLGAIAYLAKPADVDEIEKSFAKTAGDASVAIATQPTNIKFLEWECIHQTLIDTDFNISATARHLGMHRRTLARKLKKTWVKQV